MIDKFIERYEQLQELRVAGELTLDNENELKEISTQILYKMLEEPKILKLFNRMKFQKTKHNNKNIPYDKVVIGIKIIAGSILQNKNIELTESSLDKETARIERCIEHYYKVDNNKIEHHYTNFISNFLLDNYKELVFGTKFSGLYLDDVHQVDWVEEIDEFD